MPAARRPPAPRPAPRPAPAPPPKPAAAPRPAPRPAPPAPRPAPKPASRPAPAPQARVAAPAPRPAARAQATSRPAPKPAPHPARKAPAAHPASKAPKPAAHPARKPPQAHPALSAAETYQRDYVTIGAQLGADELAILAALCAGFGENEWNADTCNTSGHCGVWQLSPSLQREHNYRDVPYWTRRAYTDGFWGKGGLIALAKRYSTHSAGYIANLCQGAYSNLDQGAAYYDRYLTQARATYAKFAGNRAAYGPSGPGSTLQQQTRPLYVNPLAHARVTPERIDQGVDYAGTGYLVAIADAVITQSVADGSGWEGEGYLEYKITQPGELENVYVYYAEGITPTLRTGDRVKAGERVANLRSVMPHGIELGFAAGSGEESYYRYHDGNYVEGTATRPGIAFSNLIARLGGPPGKIEGSVVGKFPEYMQTGEPNPAVTSQPQAGGTDNPLGGGIGLVGQFDWPGGLLSAFVQIQRGATQGAHHSHAAWFDVRGITYVPKSD